MSRLSPLGQDLASIGKHSVSFPAGGKIYKEGEIGTEMYVIRSGEVEVLKTFAGEVRVLAVLRKGDFFGEMSLLEDMPREETVRARTKVVLVRITATVLEKMLKSDPGIAVRMIRKLSRRAREAEAWRAVEARNPGGGAPDAPEPRRAKDVPPEASGEPCELVSPDRATRFPVREGDTIIGRGDSSGKNAPDVDLTALDPERSVSRRHARLYRIGAAHYLMEEIGVSTGTFVNEVKLSTGVPSAVRHGDSVRFGLVTFTFWKPA